MRLRTVRKAWGQGLLASALVLAVCASVALLGISPGKARASGAESFCVSVTLGYYGGPNDACAAPAFHLNYYVAGYGLQHSVCVSTTTNGAKSGLNMSWSCSAGPESQVTTSANGGVWTTGIIRNNTTGASTNVSAQEAHND